MLPRITNERDAHTRLKEHSDNFQIPSSKILKLINVNICIDLSKPRCNLLLRLSLTFNDKLRDLVREDQVTVRKVVAFGIRLWDAFGGLMVDERQRFNSAFIVFRTLVGSRALT